MKSRKYIVLAIVIGYLCFAMVVLVGFFYVRDNPKDITARTYIYENASQLGEYGEIEYVARYLKKTIEKENVKYYSYSVETEDYEVIVYVGMVKENGEWTALSMEVEEVRELDN